MLDPIGDQFVTEGQTLDTAITASDADDDGPAISASGLPGFAVLVDNGNGSATLSIDPLVGDAGTYPVTIRVTDDGLPALVTTEDIDIVVEAQFIYSDGDGDGIGDSQEVLFGTDPNLADTDGDGLDDGVEIGFDGDSDNYDPYHPVSNPGGTDLDANSTDSDGDGLDDQLEYDNTSGTEPIDPNDWPNFATGDVAPWNAPDGFVNAGDYAVATRIALGLLPATPMALAYGDMDMDDDIDAVDLQSIRSVIFASPLIQPVCRRPLAPAVGAATGPDAALCFTSDSRLEGLFRLRPGTAANAASPGAR